MRITRSCSLKTQRSRLSIGKHGITLWLVASRRSSGARKRIMDKVSATVRSTIMAKIRSRGTTIEGLFASELRRRRLRFRQHLAWLGCPDFAFPRSGVVVFLDSCFWHRCPYHFRMPTSRREYWTKKIFQNVMPINANSRLSDLIAMRRRGY